jgi:hypothetical protein
MELLRTTSGFLEVGALLINAGGQVLSARLIGLKRIEDVLLEALSLRLKADLPRAIALSICQLVLRRPA